MRKDLIPFGVFYNGKMNMASVFKRNDVGFIEMYNLTSIKLGNRTRYRRISWARYYWYRLTRNLSGWRFRRDIIMKG